MNFKKIHLGQLIKQKVEEDSIDINRICKLLKCSTHEVYKMYESESLDTLLLLSWSKLLAYDFFRIYTQHLILFSSPQEKKTKRIEKTSLPEFRKNIYTKEMVDFILHRINSGEMTKQQATERYRIPKTTLYKWVNKYNTDNNKKL